MGFYHLPVCGSLQLTPRVGANPDGLERELSDSGFNSRPRVGANAHEGALAHAGAGATTHAPRVGANP